MVVLTQALFVLTLALFFLTQALFLLTQSLFVVTQALFVWGRVGPDLGLVRPECSRSQQSVNLSSPLKLMECISE